MLISVTPKTRWKSINTGILYGEGDNPPLLPHGIVKNKRTEITLTENAEYILSYLIRSPVYQISKIAKELQTVRNKAIDLHNHYKSLSFSIKNAEHLIKSNPYINDNPYGKNIFARGLFAFTTLIRSFWNPAAAQELAKLREYDKNLEPYQQMRSEAKSLESNLKRKIEECNSLEQKLTTAVNNVINNKANKKSSFEENVLLANLNNLTAQKTNSSSDDVNNESQKIIDEYMSREVIIKEAVKEELKSNPNEKIIQYLLNANSLSLPEVPTQYELNDTQKACYRLAVEIGDKDPETAFKLLAKANLGKKGIREDLMNKGAGEKISFAELAEDRLEVKFIENKNPKYFDSGKPIKSAGEIKNLSTEKTLLSSSNAKHATTSANLTNINTSDIDTNAATLLIQNAQKQEQEQEQNYNSSNSQLVVNHAKKSSLKLGGSKDE